MNTPSRKNKFEENQRINMVLLALCFIISAAIGYGIAHFLLI